MDVKRAREIMGEELEGKTDEEVLNFIQSTGMLVDMILNEAIKTHKQGKLLNEEYKKKKI